MNANPGEKEKEKIVKEFVDLLPMLRARLGITQQELGERVGATRQTIMFVENKRRQLTWSMFLSLAFLFVMDSRTRPFLMASGIISEDLSRILFGDTSMLTETTSMLAPDKPMLSKAQDMISGLIDKKENNK